MSYCQLVELLKETEDNDFSDFVSACGQCSLIESQKGFETILLSPIQDFLETEKFLLNVQ